MAVEVRNAQRKVRLNLRGLRGVASGLLKEMGLAEGDLSILLTDDQQMAEIHGRWLGIKRSTDVLSFPQQPNGPVPARQRPLLGDVVISVETAARRSAPGRSRPQRVDAEVTRCLIHGLLHLAGFDHARAGDRKEMNRLARRLQQAVERG